MATAVLACLARPRRHIEVGPTSAIMVAGFRHVPWLYDRIVGPLASLVIFRGPRIDSRPGNVLVADTANEAHRGGWIMLGRRRGDPAVRSSTSPP